MRLCFPCMHHLSSFTVLASGREREALILLLFPVYIQILPYHHDKIIKAIVTAPAAGLYCFPRCHPELATSYCKCALYFGSLRSIPQCSYPLETSREGCPSIENVLLRSYFCLSILYGLQVLILRNPEWCFTLWKVVILVINLNYSRNPQFLKFWTLGQSQNLWAKILIIFWQASQRDDSMRPMQWRLLYITIILNISVCCIDW